MTPGPSPSSSCVCRPVQRSQVEQAAEASLRSLNAELVFRLQQSFEGEVPADASDQIPAPAASIGLLCLLVPSRTGENQSLPIHTVHRMPPYTNPLDTLKPLKPQQEVVSFLSKAQVATLVSALRAYSTFPHLALISEICLATGARWSEAQRLTWPMVRAGCVVFANTKSKRVRTVPISQELQDRLEAYFAKKDRFPFCREAFARMLKRCDIELPRGQCAHVLRHTFASHFMMNGGNILALKEILGHTSLNMTMRYAHLSPEYLQDAVKLNPISVLDSPVEASLSTKGVFLVS